MGNHRAERRGPRRRPSVTDTGSQTAVTYAGRRVAAPVDFPVDAPTVTASSTHYFGDLDATAELPMAQAQTPGKRKAVKHAGSRGPLFKGVPSAPILLGVATLAVAVGGTLTAGAGSPALTGNIAEQVRPATALSGAGGVVRVDTLRGTQLSRNSDRGTLAQATDSDLVEVAEAQAEERNAALGALAAQAEKQAKKIEENRWLLPLSPSVITATFGQYGLWSSYHTGLDFNGNTGDPISAIANGVVTFVGYDGAYGNKTVVTLEDGTELWYCHQTDQYVSEGDIVTGGETIGTVGTTGNVTGSHLHVEVRPGGGDPVDPYAAFVVHGVTP